MPGLYNPKNGRTPDLAEVRGLPWVCWGVKGTRNPTARHPALSRRPCPTAGPCGIAHIRPICAIPDTSGRSRSGPLKRGVLPEPVEQVFQELGDPFVCELRGFRWDREQPLAVRCDHQRSDHHRLPPQMSSGRDALLPLPLFLRFSRGRHKQVGKLRRVPGGVTFLSGLTGRPSRNRGRSVRPSRDLWSVAVG